MITLLATATDERLERFAGLTGQCFIDRRKQTLVFVAGEDHLAELIEAATASAVTLQAVHDPGRGEWYETVWQGPMEGWASRYQAGHV